MQYVALVRDNVCSQKQSGCCVAALSFFTLTLSYAYRSIFCLPGYVVDAITTNIAGTGCLLPTSVIQPFRWLFDSLEELLRFHPVRMR